MQSLFEMGEDQCGAGDVSDLAWAGGDVLQDAPAVGEQGEPAFAQAAQRTLKRVAGAGIEVMFPAAGWLLDRDEDADRGAVVPGVGRRAARSGRPAGGPGRRCRLPSLFPVLAPGWPVWPPFGWTVALAWGKLW